MDDSFVAEYDFTMDSDLSTEALQGRNIAGDEAFYAEVARVLGNLKLIRTAQPNCGILVSFVENAAGEKFKIILQ
jgi:hypothetical protein